MHSGVEVARQVEVVEEAARIPYTKILEPFFLATYHANGKDYSPNDDMVRGLENPPFVSKLATKAAKEKYDAKTAGAAGVASAVAVVTTTTPLLLPIPASGVWMES